MAQESAPFFALRALTGSAAWNLLDLEVRQVWLLYNELAVSQQRQLTASREMVAHCLQNVPYYREQFLAAWVVPQGIRTLTISASSRSCPVSPAASAPRT